MKRRYKVCTARKERFARADSVMEGRFIWLLEELCRRNGVDIQLIDHSVTYSENKEEIESLTGIKLRFSQNAREIDEEEYREWAAMEDRYNELVGIKKGRKKDKKIPVDIGNIIRVAKGEE